MIGSPVKSVIVHFKEEETLLEHARENAEHAARRWHEDSQKFAPNLDSKISPYNTPSRNTTKMRKIRSHLVFENFTAQTTGTRR